ncbi:hypothetical protein FNAPI_9186 [Fusarium napiforme]|uniref:Uncharacterized protein n=1 Tax=Fusarium napiforme TaxID=42672 RepID=A0A8H5IY20_9HYPO|nr:hypothetical protein FNAPI_9186 [Fusarium napiforme]
MPTQEVLNQWEASSPTTKSEGPLLGVQQDRVRNSGARTPGSIHADIIAQIEAKRERKTSEEAEKEKKKAEGEKST